MRRRQLMLAALPLSALAVRAAPAPLELNRASRAELESLPGIGPALADRLLAERERRAFSDWVDLRQRVKGLGAATARALSAQGLRVQGQAYDDAMTRSPSAGATAPASPPSSSPEAAH